MADLRDRLTGEDLSLAGLPVGEHLLADRYALTDDGWLNGVASAAGTRVIPQPDGRWALATNGRSREGRIANDVTLRDVTRDTLQQLSAEVRRRTLVELADLSPLVAPGAGGREVDDVVDAAERALPFLHAIVNQPYTRLRSVDEVVPIGAVRRVRGIATQHLAAHSELWGQRTVAGVRPIRLLSERAEDELAIYENRVVVRSLALAAQRLDERLGRLDDLAWFHGRLEELVSRLEGRPWRATHSAARLLGEAYDPRERDEVSALRLILEDVRARLGALQDTPFARDVPELPRSAGLEWTNLLRDDLRYRRSAELWDDLRPEPAPTPEQLAAAAHRTAMHFGDYVDLLLARAAQELGWLWDDEHWHYTRDGFVLTVTRDDDRVFVVRCGSRSLRVVPLAHPLRFTPDPGSVRRLMAQLEDAAARIHDDMLVVLYPADGHPPRDWPPDVLISLGSLGTDRRDDSRLAVLPVGPLEPDGVQRVTRLLTWLTVGWRWTDQYPVDVRLASSDHAALVGVLTDWTEKSTKPGVIRVIRSPDSGTLDKLAALAGARGGPSKDSVDALLSAAASLDLLTRCPACDQQVTWSSITTSSGTFWARCASCETSFGTVTCTACRRAYPVLDVAGVDRDRRGREPGWLDDDYGSEVLSTPCWLPGSADFACAWCGACRDSRPGNECLRCSAVK